MGVFSEISMDEVAEQEQVDTFTLEQQDIETATELFPDEEKQQAESMAAKAALSYLKEQEEPAEEDAEPECSEEDDSEDESEGEDTPKAPAAPKLSPEQQKKEFEEKEAERKALWEAERAEKLEAEFMAWETAVAVNDDELTKVSMGRIGGDAERLTRRNMKICVAEHVQTKCLEDMDFARQVMYPRKNMINCYHYINRQALEFIKNEMKDNDEKMGNDGIGGDVPDDLCYKWAEDYFNDLDAPEDFKDDEKFVAKHYTGPSSKAKKPAPKKAEKKPVAKEAPKVEEAVPNGQMSLLGGVAV